ncbi:unnamed protein product [Eruca vesicaria subsp. sativa]|uniref:NAD(+) diphosphatase n=1 Tax=Eruca vesicaria subsp. sativa TaxID=29727 RepID=A0ABC8L029_ERUVS|nr:unnamed protein product [Eruca vesicaria subsp. sativa]
MRNQEVYKNPLDSLLTRHLLSLFELLSDSIRRFSNCIKLKTFPEKVRSLCEKAKEILMDESNVQNEDLVYWAVDLSSEQEHGVVLELGSKKLCFVEVRTLMVAADWEDERAMDELAIEGHARALLEWHKVSRFCGACGGLTVPKEAERRKQCSNEACGKRVYPRVDPVVIMLVIDRENDRALLSRQARFVPRMWSCLAGFIEPGESLEEVVRRETWEETGIEVGEIVYHSSQPWPGHRERVPREVYFCTLFTPNARFDVSGLAPASEYCFKVVSFSGTRELGVDVINVMTRSPEERSESLSQIVAHCLLTLLLLKLSPVLLRPTNLGKILQKEQWRQRF